jgi:putative glutamine amidotransferase
MCGMPPRIGLPTYREQARWGSWERSADLLPADYAARIREAGGVPVLLPPGEPKQAESALGGVHGLVLTGGADIDPARYGAPAHPQTGPLRPERDSWEFALVSAALAWDMPILGICRGLQLLNVALGGTLIQYLPEVVGHQRHRPAVGHHATELVTVAAGSRLAELVGERLEVAAHHRQAVGSLGRGLLAMAWADDGTVEAVEFKERRWVIAVQWHPEISGAGQLFHGLVDACNTTMATRS